MSDAKRFKVADLYHSCNEDTIVVNAEQYDAAKSRLAALREELAEKQQLSEIFYKRQQIAESKLMTCESKLMTAQQRLADAERRNEMLTDLLRRTQSDGALTYEENLKLESDIDAALNPKPEAASHDE